MKSNRKNSFIIGKQCLCVSGRINPKNTALLIIDPQNDFLSEGGVVWDLVGKGVKETKVVENLVEPFISNLF